MVGNAIGHKNITATNATQNVRSLQHHCTSATLFRSAVMASDTANI